MRGSTRCLKMEHSEGPSRASSPRKETARCRGSPEEGRRKRRRHAVTQVEPEHDDMGEEDTESVAESVEGVEILDAGSTLRSPRPARTFLAWGLWRHRRRHHRACRLRGCPRRRGCLPVFVEVRHGLPRRRPSRRRRKRSTNPSLPRRRPSHRRRTRSRSVRCRPSHRRRRRVAAPLLGPCHRSSRSDPPTVGSRLRLVARRLRAEVLRHTRPVSQSALQDEGPEVTVPKGLRASGGAPGAGGGA